jgi:hypothetical protein
MTNLIGLAELAELYGVSKNTANTWARRHDWPAPVATLKMGPVWDRETILAHKPIVIDHQQRHILCCAWCGGNGISDSRIYTAFSDSGASTFNMEITCGDCGKVSEAYFRKEDNDHFFDGASLRVERKEIK